MNRVKVRALTKELLARALRNPAEWEGVTVLLVTDRRMCAMNRTCFGRFAPTDVITMAYPPCPPALPAWRGEVILNTDCARREGVSRGSVAHELALYLAHGCDHLNGSDDATPADRARMRRRENRWLRRPDIHPLIEPCLEAPRDHA